MFVVLLYTDLISWVYIERSESRVLSSDWLPANQEIYINKKVKYGNVDPVDLMAFMDDYRSGNFKVKTLETQWNSKITPFKKTIYDETARGAQPGQSDQYGSYEFFELNTTSHKYMFTTLVNITSPHASILFP